MAKPMDLQRALLWAKAHVSKPQLNGQRTESVEALKLIMQAVHTQEQALAKAEAKAAAYDKIQAKMRQFQQLSYSDWMELAVMEPKEPIDGA